MANQRVTLFLRIDKNLKNKLIEGAKADGRSVTRFSERILEQKFEVENERSDVLRNRSGV
jgi:predicted HicB family RNase H-like nuclease